MSRDFLAVVEFVLAIGLFISGSYILINLLLAAPVVPFHPATEPTILPLVGSVGVFLLGLSYTMISVTHIWALITDRLGVRASMITMQLLVRIYGLILSVFAASTAPLIWFQSVILLMVLIVCWAALKMRIASLSENRNGD